LEVHAEQPREISMPVSDKDIIMYHAWPKRKEAVLFSGEHWPYGQLHSVPLTEESLSPDFEREFTPPPNAKFGDTDVFFTEEGCILFSAVKEGMIFIKPVLSRIVGLSLNQFPEKLMAHGTSDLRVYIEMVKYYSFRRIDQKVWAALTFSTVLKKGGVGLHRPI
jgi:hypothetical protein